MRLRLVAAGLVCATAAACTSFERLDPQQELPFRWSVDTAPAQELGPLEVEQLRRILRTERPVEHFEFSVMAAYPSRDAAAQAVAEARTVTTRYTKGRGVVQIGPILVVRGIGTRAEARAAGQLLRAPDVTVAVFDVPSENTPTLDLSCRPTDRTAAKTFASDVDDYLRVSQFHPRPPWVGRPISAEERRARMTVRRIPALAHDKAQQDPEFKRIGQELWNSRGTPDHERLKEIGERMGERLLELQPEVVDDSMDAAVAAIFVSQPPLDGPSFEPYYAWSRAVGERLGSLRLERKGEFLVPSATPTNAQAAFAYDARLGSRLDIATLWSQTWPAPLAALLLKLSEIGCDDVRFALFDYVDVRQD